MDKKQNTSRDIALDTEPHLLFENIQDLYNDKGDLDEKYKYLLHLTKNRGIESKMMQNLPRYHEIDFFDKLPLKLDDATLRKKKMKTSLDSNQEFHEKFKKVKEYKDLMSTMSLRDINYSFTPRPMKFEDLMKEIMDILEERTKLHATSRIQGQGYGLHKDNYFNFSKFVLEYYTRLFPQNIKREKFLFNFLVSLDQHSNNELVAVISDLLKGTLQYKDLVKLLMVKDFVKFHLRKSVKLSYVDLAKNGVKFQHSDDLIELLRVMIINYDDNFKVFYEEKFIKLKGDDEFLTLFDFIGLATRAFHDLEREGHTPVMKKLTMYLPERPTKYYEDGGHTIDNHKLKCYGRIPVETDTGLMQDRNKKKKKDEVNWCLWSDYPNKAVNKPRELTSREVGDFFSIELDDKVRKMQEHSARKKGQKVISPVPYQNMTEKARGIIDKLDAKIKREEDPDGYLARTLSPKRQKELEDQAAVDLEENPVAQDKFARPKFSHKEELEIFGVFDQMNSKLTSMETQKPILDRLKELEKKEQEQKNDADKKSRTEAALEQDRKMQTIYELLNKELLEKCNM